MRRVSRRSFLRAAVQLGAGAILYKFDNGTFKIALAAGPETYQLRIVHTNDHHSRIEPVGVTIGSSGGASITRNLGGVSRRRTLFDAIRAEPTPVDKLFLDAGDVFQGTLYFNRFEGVADQWFYNQLGYHVGTIGNHEFDKGDQIFANFVAAATYPIVCANLAAAAPSPLNPLKVAGASTGVGQIADRTIVTLPSGKKIGVFGLITPETANISSPSAAVTFDEDLAAVAQAQVDALKAAGADIVVALTHIGYLNDLELARATRGISVIVGGHSHTPLLNNPGNDLPYGQPRNDGPYPTVATDLDNNTTLVLSDWEWGKWVGDVVIGFDAANLVTSAASGSNPKPVWADGIVGGRALLPNEGAEIAPDAAFETQITTVYKPEITTLANTLIGSTTVELSNALVRSAETPLGNLLADSFRAWMLDRPADNPDNLPLVVLLNGGGIRTSIPAGDIMLGQLLEVTPFGNTLARVDLTGAQLKAALENGVSALGGTSGTGRFPQVSGLRFWFSRRGLPARPPVAATSTTPALPAQPGTRVARVQVLIGSEYEELEPARLYRVITNNFMMGGGDGYFVMTTAGDRADPSVGGGVNQLDTGFIDADVSSAYVTANSPLTPLVEGRIVELIDRQIMIGIFKDFSFATP